VIYLSNFQAEQLVGAHLWGKEEIGISLDLGISLDKVKIKEDEFEFPDNQKLSLRIIRKIAKSNDQCFFVEGSEAFKIQLLSKDTNKFLKLHATGLATAPVREISGIPMQKHKDMSPLLDAKRKIDEIAPISGKVLDTCCSLGYTAILAGQSAEVNTFEIDPGVIEIARHNPHSQELFSNPRIKLEMGDVSEEIKKLEQESFDFIVHDPPTLSIAGDLYSSAFFSELLRVLKPKGRLYHYAGSPGAKYRNQDIVKGVKKRLKGAGFLKVSDTYDGVKAKA
jgi:hypothetical protein